MLFHHYLNMVETTLNTWKWYQTMGNNIEQQEITLSYFVPSFNTIKKVVLVVHLLFNVVGPLLSFEIAYLCKRRCGLSKIA